eukprot:GEMP01026884.1.p1 GENE.GEMP01026884.1~~GEMP01026884.1.p1  ORF type:complete len:405 (-),score=77.77 GEMP01026884.1:1042-2256(-)
MRFRRPQLYLSIHPLRRPTSRMISFTRGSNAIPKQGNPTAMRSGLHMAQQAYESKFGTEDASAQKRVRMVAGSALIAFGCMYCSYCLSDVTSNIQLLRMMLYKQFCSPREAFDRLHSLAKTQSLPVDLDVDRPWMQTKLGGRRLVNACGGPPCDPSAEWATSLIRMGFGFVEVGPVAIAANTEDVSTPYHVIPPDVRWEDLSTPLVSAEAWRAPVDILKQKLDDMKRIQHTAELTVNGIIGIEVAQTDTFEDSVALCSLYADYLCVRVDAGSDMESLVAAVRRTTTLPLFLKFTMDVLEKCASPCWLEKVTCEDNVGIVVDSLEAVKVIRQRNKQLVIICANISSGADAVRAVEAGAHCFQLTINALLDQGPSVARQVKDDFTYLINVRGHHSLEEAIGKRKKT